MKRPKKVSLINVWDYPKNDYSAYWEIVITEGDPYKWEAKILSYEPVAWEHGGVVTSERPDVQWPTYPPDLPAGATEEQREARLKLIQKLWDESPKPIHLLEVGGGTVGSRDEADEAAQQWVLSQMEAYRRDEPLHRYTDDEVDNLVATFDLARKSLDFARVDSIRGLLKAQGVVLDEGESIGYGGPTTWKRV
jgi:hypothetical protein